MLIHWVIASSEVVLIHGVSEPLCHSAVLLKVSHDSFVSEAPAESPASAAADSERQQILGYGLVGIQCPP